MAEGVLSSNVAKILELIGSQVFKEIGLAYGVKEEISKLKDTVRTINAVLQDAEKQYNKNAQVTIWLQRLRDAFYDADDLLDDFSIEFSKLELMDGGNETLMTKVRTFFSTSTHIAYSLKMGHKIKAIRKRLDEIKSDRQFHLNENPVEKREMVETHSFVRVEDVIGRDDDKIAIKTLLLESNDVENVSVIPIVGFGGVGKTTLVQSLYNAHEITNHFQLKLWVCVSDVFDVKVIVENIIKSATGGEVGKLNMDQVQERLRRLIDGKKYLLVLDDLWNEDRDSWLKLKTLLMDGASGSRIVVTTRSVRVAEITRTLPFYTLTVLTDDMSWILFTRMAFEQGMEPEGSRLVTIGKEIVAKCAGIPLVIRTIGTLLYSRHEEAEWLHFRDHEMSKIAQDSDILPTLKLSYDHLPSHLKECFAYCALFPKDHMFEKNLLINLWMAQGFIQSTNMVRCLEDVGNEYFMTLLSRSFFQDAISDEWGSVTGCKMHDLMHDLSISVAGSDCTVVPLDANLVNESARHISIYSKFGPSWEFPPALHRPNHIRTLFLSSGGPGGCYNYNQNGLNISSCDKLFSSFRSLRTLNLSSSGIRKVSDLIGKLKHLRYLDLSENLFEELPNSMSMLRKLQTLKLSYCSNLKKLPRDMRKMVSLKHLITHGCYDLTNMPCGVGLLTSLRTLPLFAVDTIGSNKNADVSELSRLNDLRGKLYIKDLGHMKSAKSGLKLTNLLEEKPFLHSIELRWDTGITDANGAPEINEELLDALQPHPNLKELTVRDFGGLTIPNWLSTLPNLTTLSLWSCRRCQYVPCLELLPSLKSLTLMDFPILEQIYHKPLSTSSTTFFPSLQKLFLYGCHNLRECWSRDSATTQMVGLPCFPSLSDLKIKKCPKLTCMPLYSSLKKMELIDASLEPLKQNTAAPSTSTTFSAPLSKLKSLTIGKIGNSESLPVERLQNLTSLVDLCIDSSLSSKLVQSITHLTSVENLIVKNCDRDELNLLDDDNDKLWQGFRSLRSLKLRMVSKLVYLPKGLQHVTSLQRLDLEFCDNLIALPEWICNFTSLLDLQILGCRELTSLPQLGMQLQNLTIRVSDNLSERCGNNMGVDWPKIAHIPNIYFEGEYIQLGGCYRL